MALPIPVPPPGFDELSIDDKIDYVQLLWDRIAADAGQVPLQDWQRQILNDRLAAHRAEPHAGRPGKDVLDELERRLRSR